MKKTIFIISASVLLFLIFLVWVYLLLFGAPKNVSNVFTNFGFGENDVTAREDTPTVPIGQTGQLSLGSASLVQLTTRPVAGFGFVSDSIATSSTKSIRYAERGVGHIYEIDLGTGVENRLLAKTFIGVTRAKFSKDGKIVVLTAEENGTETTFLESIDNNNANHQFPPNARNIGFINSEAVLYTLSDEVGTTGYSYNLDSGTTDEIFNTPLIDIAVLWGKEETLLYNKMAPRLRGSLYRITGNVVTQIGDSGYAFSAFNNPQLSGLYIETTTDLETSKLQSSVFNDSTGKSSTLPIMTLPEKCVFDSLVIEILWCTAPLDNFNRTGHSDWFKGIIISNDLLWKVDLSKNEASVIDDFVTTVGHTLDAVYPDIDKTSTYILFKNKLDDSLWLKDLKFSQKTNGVVEAETPVQ